MTTTRPFLATRTTEPAAATGPAVLLIHGFMSSGGNDWPAASWGDALAARGRKTIVVDLPAHGESAPVGSASAATTGRIVAAVSDLIASEGVVDVIGYSLGARIAWALAARRPDLVNRAVLGGLSAGDPFAALDYAAARAFAKDGTPPADRMTAMLSGMVVGSGQDAGSLFNLMQGLGSEAFDPAAEAPVCPVAIVAGADDQIAAGADGLVRHLANGGFERVPGDHFGAPRGPEFRAAAFRFLGLAS